MARVMTDNKYYAEIAAAIREKNGGTGKYTPAQMAAAIRAIQSGGVLPDGYTQLNYIESTGTQYIDTGFKPNQDTRVVTAVSFRATPSKDEAVFGTRNANTNQLWCYWRNAAAKFSFRFGGSSTNNLVAAAATEKNVLNADGNVLTIGSASVTATAATFTAEHSIFLFAVNNAGASQYPASVLMYSCKIYDNGTLVRDFVPCRNPLGEVGLYDLVNGVFYCNAGTGSFIASLPLVSLPDGYTQVEYIQSSGTQYINTGFKPNQDTRAVMDAQILKDPGTSVAIYFGVRWDGGFFELYKAGSGANLTFLYNTTYSQAFTVDYTLRRTVEINKNTATVDGVTKSYTAGTFQSSLPLFLCADNEYGAVKSHTAMRLYSCQIYDSGTLVRDFVPCKNASGAFGLYDRVGDQFYGNAGTGSFTGA